MENKVIDLAAANINISLNPEPQVTASVSITDVTASISNPSVGPTASISNVQLDVRLKGFGEESFSNYGNLFVRPSQWLNIANISEANAKGYGKLAAETVVVQPDIFTKSIGVANNFVITATEEVIKTTDFSRQFFEGGIESWYYSPDYAEQAIGYVKPRTTILFTDQKFIGIDKGVVELAAVVSVDTKIIETTKLEFVESFETVQKGYSKPLFDTVTSSDDVFGEANLDDDQYVLFIKVLSHQVAPTETFSQIIQSLKLDQGTFSDLNAKSLLKVSSESLTALDQFVTTTVFRPQFTDTAVTSDDFLGTASPDDDQYVEFIKVLNNQIFIAEQSVVNIAKILNPLLVTSSETNQKTYQKLVLDQVRPTDDFLGAANIDDDQYVVFVKQVEDLAVLQEVQEYLVDFKRFFVDVPVLVDAAAKMLEKTAQQDSLDSVTDNSVWNLNKEVIEDSYFFDRYTKEDFSEDNRPNSADAAPVFQLQFNLLDYGQTLELISFNSLKTLATPFTSLDVFAASYTSPKLEQVAANETRQLLVNKTAADSLVVGDFDTIAQVDKLTPETVLTQSVSVIDILKQLTSQVSATDDFLGEANIDDDQIAVFIKVLEDSVSITDTLDAKFTPTTPVFDGSILSDIFSSSTIKVAEDLLTANDTPSIFGEKVLESQAISTLEQAFNVSKVLVDAPDWFSAGYVTESYTLGGAAVYETFSKNLQTVLLPDSLSGVYETLPVFNASKVLVSLSNSVDLLSFNLQYNLADQVLSTDDFFGLSNVDDDQIATVGKVLQDSTSGTSEVTTYTAQKILLDFGLAVDQGTVNNLNKVLQDQVFSTDDFFGLANIDDDQIATVGKVLNTSLSAVSDNLVTLTDTRRAFSDVLLIGQEVQIFAAIKGIETSAILSDEKSFVNLKSLQDAYSPQEQSAKTVGKQLDNSEDYVSIGYAESLYVYRADAKALDVADLHIQPVLIETANLAETLLVFDVESGLVDLGVFAEQNSKELLFNLLDNLYVTDDFLGEANIDDDQYALFIKALTDIPVTLEQQVYFVQKTLLDTGTALEQAAMDSSKVLSDIANNLIEQKVVEFTKALNSSVVTAELLTFLIVQGRTFLDTLNAFQEIKLSTTKVANETVTGQDLSVVVLEKFNPEFITCTHQELTQNYGKSVIGPDFFLEIYSDGYTKGGVATAEFAYKAFNKPIPLPELVVVSDPASKLVGKTPTEQTSVVETLFILTLQKSNPETITVAEVLQRVMSTVIADAAVSLETATAFVENYLPPQFAQAGYVGTTFTL